MKLQLAICAQGVSIDRLTNRLSIFNLLETIEAPRFPVFLPEVVFLVLLRREKDEPTQFDGEVVVMLDDVTIAKGTAHVDFENSLQNRQVITFQGFPVPNPGELKFQLTFPNLEPFFTTLPVVQTKPVPANAGTS